MSPAFSKIEDGKLAVLQYQCGDCFNEFCLLDDKPTCPNCGSRELSHLVIIYKEDDPELEVMMTASDLHAGD